MVLTDWLGYAFVGLLLAGHLWGVVDLLIRIQKQPRQPVDLLRLSPYPLVPEEEPVPQARPGSHRGGSGGLRLSPVPVEVKHRAAR